MVVRPIEFAMPLLKSANYSFKTGSSKIRNKTNRVVHFATDAVNRHLTVRRNLRFGPSQIELQA